MGGVKKLPLSLEYSTQSFKNHCFLIKIYYCYLCLFHSHRGLILSYLHFEFSLIQKSLEIENKLIEDQNDRKEYAKKLLFLVKSGIIQSLNSKSI